MTNAQSHSLLAARCRVMLVGNLRPELFDGRNPDVRYYSATRLNRQPRWCRFRRSPTNARTLCWFAPGGMEHIALPIRPVDLCHGYASVRVQRHGRQAARRLEQR